MTVAAGVKIGLGAEPEAVFGRGLGGSRNAAQAGATGRGLVLSPASGTESFGARWQSLLVSMGTMTGSKLGVAEDDPGAGEAASDQSSSSDGPALKTAASDTSKTTSTLSTSQTLQLRRAAEPVSAENASRENLARLKYSQAGAWAGASAVSTASIASTGSNAKTPTATAPEKRAASEPASKSAKSSRAESSTNAVQTGTEATGLNYAELPASVSVPQALPVQAAANAVVEGAEAGTQSPAKSFAQFTRTTFSLYDTSVSQPNGISSASSDRQSLLPEAQEQPAGATRAAQTIATQSPRGEAATMQPRELGETPSLNGSPSSSSLSNPEVKASSSPAAQQAASTEAAASGPAGGVVERAIESYASDAGARSVDRQSSRTTAAWPSGSQAALMGPEMRNASAPALLPKVIEAAKESNVVAGAQSSDPVAASNRALPQTPAPSQYSSETLPIESSRAQAAASAHTNASSLQTGRTDEAETAAALKAPDNTPEMASTEISLPTTSLTPSGLQAATARQASAQSASSAGIARQTEMAVRSAAPLPASGPETRTQKPSQAIPSVHGALPDATVSQRSTQTEASDSGTEQEAEPVVSAAAEQTMDMKSTPETSEFIVSAAPMAANSMVVPTPAVSPDSIENSFPGRNSDSAATRVGTQSSVPALAGSSEISSSPIAPDAGSQITAVASEPAQKTRPVLSTAPEATVTESAAQRPVLIQESPRSRESSRSLEPSRRVVTPKQEVLPTAVLSPNPDQEQAPTPVAPQADGDQRSLVGISAHEQNAVPALSQARVLNQVIVVSQAPILSQVPASTGSAEAASVQTAASAAVAQSMQPSPAPLTAGRSKSSGGERNTAPSGLRSVSGAEIAASAQGTGTAAEVSAMAREGVGAHMASNATGGHLGVSSTATGQDSRETFATLDAAGAPGGPTWVHASAQRAEAGYHDPALGWVSVRADASGGGVHAELVPATADAAQALGGHLAGLNAFLAERHSTVDTVTVTAPENGWAGSTGSGSERGSGDAMQQGAGQQSGEHAGQNAAQSSAASAQSGSASISMVEANSAREAATVPAEVDHGAMAAGLRGRHISVMA